MVLLLVGFVVLFFREAKAEESVVDKWKSHVELSYVRTSGNSETESLAGKFEGLKKSGQNRFSVNGNVFQASTKKENTASKVLAEGKYDRFVSERAFFFIVPCPSKIPTNIL